MNARSQESETGILGFLFIIDFLPFCEKIVKNKKSTCKWFQKELLLYKQHIKCYRKGESYENRDEKTKSN